MRSMTGFGRGISSVSDGQITVEIKTVNHRFLEIRTRVPVELNSLESAIEKEIRNRLERGYCTVHVTYNASDAATVRISENTLTSYIRQLQRIADKTSVPVEALLKVLVNAPDLFETPSASRTEDVVAATVAACQEAVKSVLVMRQSEGEHMANDVWQRLDAIEQQAGLILEKAGLLESSILVRYRARIEDLLPNGQRPDDIRLETEAAIFAEKADINEEINRLFSHVRQMRNVFDEPGAVGRRMDFLVQEMGREANTIASKSVVSEITHLVVSIKGELEKIRELVQNIE
ncbi:MAG: YicC family protein [Deltaproteobacteria bacterium]|nr:YicC family protein [Deltaproteobacteria bacterium]